MLGVVFLISQFSAMKIYIISFIFTKRIILKTIEDIDFLESILKRHFTSKYFLQNFRSLKIANLTMLWTDLCELCRFYL